MEEDANNSIVAKEKLDLVATWVGSTVSSAFFSSLERFSCVNVTTDDDEEEEDDDDGEEKEEANSVKNPPLSVTEQTQVQHDDVSKLPV
ncbi:hypothetical protein F8388_016975 [Cannabis sativa]|uniref:Uncharacterized protein n=1 Tax=Cannabis sativa TaxID=3483 RepID=A0A7J6E5K2_CANSA|nr:hypothetical protein F8388_016975 [Cannabis sativa]